MIAGLSDQLLADIHSRWRRRRLHAVEQLKALSPADAVPALAGLLQDRRSHVAFAAADALCEHFGEAGRAALLRTLDEDHEWARLAAARGLARDLEPRALRALDVALRGPDADQWGPALDRIILFGPAARPVIERELLDEENGSPWLREMCARALPEAVGEEARPALTRAASSRNKLVARAAKGSLAYLDEIS